MSYPGFEAMRVSKLQIGPHHVRQCIHPLCIRHHSPEVPRVVMPQPVIGAFFMPDRLMEVLILERSIQI